MAHSAAAAVAGLLASVKDSSAPSTHRQRSWALRELLDYAAADLATPAASIDVAQLLDPALLDRWMSCAERGTLRRRASGSSAAAASMRARAAAARQLAAHAGVSFTLPPKARVAVRAATPPASLASAMVALKLPAPVGITAVSWARTTAVAALCLELSARLGELAELVLDDVETAESGPPTAVRISRRLPGGAGWGPDVVEPLRPQAAELLHRWLQVRHAIVTTHLRGGKVQALWVGVGPGGEQHHNPTAGLPASYRTLHRSWRKAHTLLAEAGHRLPADLGQLRR